MTGSKRARLAPVIVAAAALVLAATDPDTLLGLGAGVGMRVGQARRTLRLWLIGLAGVVVFDLVSGGLIRDTIQRTIGDWVVEQRLSLTLAGVLLFAAHPVLGVGPGG